MTTAPRFFDSHAHLDGSDFTTDIEGTLSRARDAGITDIVCIGASEGFDSNARALAVADAREGKSGPTLWATVGVHPHDAKIVDAECLSKVRELAAHPKVVAIGETGLDYYYDHSPKEKQQEVFREFLRMAKSLALPAVIHTRDAEDDTIAILRDEDATSIGGVIHCFTGTEKLARAALDVGFYISFSGVVTFRNADPLRAIARDLPRDRVLVETDCPYLTPVPYRGKKNEPAYITETTKTIASLWGVAIDDVKRTTGENAARLFRATSQEPRR
jgi:TatD DNase family protein